LIVLFVDRMTFGTNEALLHYHGLLKKTEKGRQLLFHIAPLQLLNFVDDLRGISEEIFIFTFVFFQVMN
jgi:hypothetical protein